MKISRSFEASLGGSIVYAIEQVLNENYDFHLDDCGFCWASNGTSHAFFTLATPHPISRHRFISLLSDRVFVGPASRHLF